MTAPTVAPPQSWFRRHILASSIAVLLVLGGAIAAAIISTGTEVKASEAGVLFSLSAPYSHIDGTGSDLTVTFDRDRHVAWFTSRPTHQGGSMSLTDFVTRWDEMGFNEVPPNAALIVRDDGVLATHVVEITSVAMDDDEVIFGISEAAETFHAGRDASHPLTAGPRDFTEFFIDSVSCDAICARGRGRLPGEITPPTVTFPSTTTTTRPVTNVAVSAVTPAAGAAGEAILVSGTGFSKVEEVFINGTAVEAFTVIDDSMLTTAVPEGATSGPVTVSSTHFDSTSAASLVVTSPAITSFTPTIATGGATIAVFGANLGGTTAVRIGGVEVPFRQISFAELSVTVGAGARSGLISVTTAAGKTTTTDTITVGAPSISSFAPVTGTAGTTVILEGVNFAGIKGVSFGGVSATYRVQSPTRIAATVPAGVVDGPITISATLGNAITEGEFIAGPSISSISPTSGIAGSTVTITGTHLDTVTMVDFVGSSDPGTAFTVVSPTTITATVPNDATTGTIRLLGATEASTSTFTVKPVISSLVPASVTAGSVVTISGSGLTDTRSVLFGRTTVAFTKVSSTQVSFTVPTNTSAGSVSVSLTTSAGTTSSTTELTVITRSGTPMPEGAPVTPSTTTSTLVPTRPANGSIIQLGSGLTFTVTSGSTSGSFTGTGLLSAGGFTFPATISISSMNDWTVFPTGPGTVTVNGITITTTTLNGTLSATFGTLRWSISGAVTSRTSLVENKITIVGADVTLVPDCPRNVSTVFCGTGPYLRLDGTAAPSKGLDINIGSGVPVQSAAPFRAALNLSSGAFNLSAEFAAAATASWAGGNVNLTDLELRLAYRDAIWAVMEGPVSVPHGAANNGFDVEVSGKGSVTIPKIKSWNISRLAVNYVDGGVVVSGSVDAPQKVGPTIVTDFSYFEVQPSVRAEILGTTAMINARTFLLSGSASTPKYLKDTLDLPNEPLGAYISYTSGGLAHVTAVLPIGIKLPKTPHLTSTFDRALLTFSINFESPDTQYEIAIAAQGTASIDGGVPFGAEVRVATGVGSGIGASISIALSAYGENGRALWPNIFGADGFDLNAFAVQMTVSPVFPFISIGLAGDGSLPGKLREYMGINSNDAIPIKFVADISEDQPCLQVSVGDPGSNTPFISLPPGVGAITASYASIEVSEFGCTVGIFEVPAGVRIKINGQMFGVSVDVFASYNPSLGGPPGMKTPAFFARADFDGNRPGRGIDLDARIHTAAGGWNPMPYFQIRGGIKIDRNYRIAITGECSVTTSGPGCNARGSGELDLYVVTERFEISIEKFLSLDQKFTATAEMNVVGVDLLVRGEFKPGGIGLRGALVLPSWSFTGTADFPRGYIIDEVSVEFGMNSGRPFGSAYAHGNLGGTFKDLTGQSGRFRVGGNFEVDAPSYHGETDMKVDLGVTRFDIIFGIDVCMSGACSGRITPIVRFKNFKGFNFSNSPLPLNPDDWTFSGTVDADWSDSGQVGDSWGGLKGTISAKVHMRVSSDNGGTFSLTASASAKAYLGVGGKWNSLGTYGVSANLSKPQFCLETRGRKVCV
jgi:hypothetical protein